MNISIPTVQVLLHVIHEEIMGRRGITAADVVVACIALTRQRRLPSVRNVRLELGRGGYGTVQKFLRLLALVDTRSYTDSKPKGTTRTKVLNVNV